jgi:hypothetical protein
LGDSLVLEDTEQVEHIFLYKKFEELCPYFISMGMTYEQFWYGDVSMTKYYIKAFEIKEKREAKNKKWTIWEQGLYIYEALCNVSPILRAFSKAKKPLPYPTKPYNIEELDNIGNEKEIKKKKEKKKEIDIMRAQIFFKNWADATKKKFKKGE